MKWARFFVCALAAGCIASQSQVFTPNMPFKARSIERIGFTQNIISRIAPDEDTAFTPAPAAPAVQAKPYETPKAEQMPKPYPAPMPMGEPDFPPTTGTPYHAQPWNDAPSDSQQNTQQPSYPARTKAQAINRSTLYTGQNIPTVEKIDNYADRLFRYGERLSGGAGAVENLPDPDFPRTTSSVRRFPTSNYSPPAK